MPGIGDAKDLHPGEMPLQPGMDGPQQAAVLAFHSSDDVHGQHAAGAQGTAHGGKGLLRAQMEGDGIAGVEHVHQQDVILFPLPVEEGPGIGMDQAQTRVVPGQEEPAPGHGAHAGIQLHHGQTQVCGVQPALAGQQPLGHGAAAPAQHEDVPGLRTGQHGQGIKAGVVEIELVRIVQIHARLAVVGIRGEDAHRPAPVAALVDQHAVVGALHHQGAFRPAELPVPDGQQEQQQHKAQPPPGTGGLGRQREQQQAQGHAPEDGAAGKEGDEDEAPQEGAHDAARRGQGVQPPHRGAGRGHVPDAQPDDVGADHAAAQGGQGQDAQGTGHGGQMDVRDGDAQRLPHQTVRPGGQGAAQGSSRQDEGQPPPGKVPVGQAASQPGPHGKTGQHHADEAGPDHGRGAHMRGQHARAHHLQHHDQGAATKSDDLQHRRPVRGRTRKKSRLSPAVQKRSPATGPRSPGPARRPYARHGD